MKRRLLNGLSYNTLPPTQRQSIAATVAAGVLGWTKFRHGEDVKGYDGRGPLFSTHDADFCLLVLYGREVPRGWSKAEALSSWDPFGNAGADYDVLRVVRENWEAARLEQFTDNLLAIQRARFERDAPERIRRVTLAHGLMYQAGDYTVAASCCL